MTAAPRDSYQLGQIGRVSATTDPQRTAARQAVTRAAIDAADERRLLAMLGLEAS